MLLMSDKTSGDFQLYQNPFEEPLLILIKSSEGVFN